MTAVIVLWVLALVAGLCWARGAVGLFSALSLLVFAVVEPSALGRPAGWLQLLALGVTPWLLAGERSRHEARLRALQADEAAHVARLSESARSLLSLQASSRRMDAQIAEIAELYHVTKETSRALHFSDLFSATLELAPQLLDASGLRLIDLTDEQPKILRASRAGDGRMVANDTNHVLDVEQRIIERARGGGAGSAGAQELGCALPEGVSRIAWAPLGSPQRLIGILVADELPEAQVKTLSIVAHQLSLQLSRIRLYRQVEALAVTDALTGLFVRHHFLERTRVELQRAARHGLSCTLLMADLDFFKQKNDTYGHLVGDVVLRDVARLLQHNLRDVDLIARFGGEEFILLLIETNIEQAMPIAQRLKQLVEVHPIRAYDELLTQTISIGAAGFPDHAQTLEQLIERADEALYEAKRAGRNRVVRYAKKGS